MAAWAVITQAQRRLFSTIGQVLELWSKLWFYIKA